MQWFIVPISMDTEHKASLLDRHCAVREISLPCNVNLLSVFFAVQQNVSLLSFTVVDTVTSEFYPIIKVFLKPL